MGAGEWRPLPGTLRGVPDGGTRGLDDQQTKWYPGVIVDVDAVRRTCDVHYDDGEYEFKVWWCYVRALSAVGTTISPGARALTLVKRRTILLLWRVRPFPYGSMGATV